MELLHDYRAVVFLRCFLFVDFRRAMFDTKGGVSEWKERKKLSMN